MSTSGRRAAAAVAVGCALLTGACSHEDAPDFPTTGTLTADDLGPGDWKGPYETWSDTGDAPGSGSMCKRITTLWSVTPTPEAKGTAVWQADDVLVWSLAFRYATPGGAADKMDDIRQLETCVDDASASNGEWTFTYDDDGTTITTHEQNSLGDPVEIETASTSKDDTVAAVLVTYPAGTTPDVSATELLDKAVTASAALSDES